MEICKILSFLYGLISSDRSKAICLSLHVIGLDSKVKRPRLRFFFGKASALPLGNRRAFAFLVAG